MRFLVRPFQASNLIIEVHINRTSKNALKGSYREIENKTGKLSGISMTEFLNRLTTTVNPDGVTLDRLKYEVIDKATDIFGNDESLEK